jgi:hypothetical protein
MRLVARHRMPKGLTITAALVIAAVRFTKMKKKASIKNILKMTMSLKLNKLIKLKPMTF